MKTRLSAVFGLITPAGRSLILLGLVCYVLDAVGGWPAFQLLWLVCVLLVLVAVAFALLPSRGKASITLSPPRTMAGDTAEVLVTVRRAGRLPVPSPLVAVRTDTTERLVRLRTPRRHRPVEERVELSDLRRGVVPIGPVTARRTDPLALLRWDERWAPAEELLVLPRIVGVETLGMGAIRDLEGIPSDEISMSDLAFHALREYVPGDDLRHVHWRSSAKASTLQIRQYHDTRRSHLTIVLDAGASSYGDSDDFETAVSVAASIAARAHQDGVEVSMLCGDHAVTGRGLDGVLDACCRIELAESDPLQAARGAMRLAPETSWLVVVTGGAAPDSLAEVVRADLAPDVVLLVVRADAASRTQVSLASGTRLLTLRHADELPRAMPAVAAGARR